MYKNYLHAVSFIALISLILLLNLTNPTTGGPAGILAVFVLIYVISVGVITSSIYYGRTLIKKLAKYLSFTIFKIGMSYKVAYYYGTILGLAPVIIIGLGSVGALGVYEVALVILFEFLGCFYVAKR